MTNVFAFDKSRGFTRMDNELMDALMAIDLAGRELKVALFIAKATINFQAGALRIKAVEVAKATNLHPDVASRAISRLLKRRVIYREGGSRGDIGICDPKEWVFVERPSRTIRSDSDQTGRVVPFASQTKTDDSHLYSKKQTPKVTLPSEEVTYPPRQPAAAKPERKKPFGKRDMLANNPLQIPEPLLDDYLALRKAKRAPITARIWSTLTAKLERCKAFGISAEQALSIAVDSGWQGFEVEWITRRFASHASQANHTPSRHTGLAHIDHTANLGEMNADGSYRI
ncbi:replication protein [Pseudomonas sp. NPDC087358]|uniref:replication protein n=1 Tax=Pseudomonas sp. NPDC087358 TaxID=3364439 RepID=UPI00384F92A6